MMLTVNNMLISVNMFYHVHSCSICRCALKCAVFFQWVRRPPRPAMEVFARLWQDGKTVMKSMGGQGSPLNSQWANLAAGMVLASRRGERNQVGRNCE